MTVTFRRESGSLRSVTIGSPKGSTICLRTGPDGTYQSWNLLQVHKEAEMVTMCRNFERRNFTFEEVRVERVER